jgi:peptide/nickel transport system permease protein
MGQLAIGAIYAHDYPVILACTFIAAAGVVVGNLLSDILYVLIDPRIKLSEG